MMGWFGIGKEIAEPVKEVGKALDELFTSDEEKAQAEFVLEKLRQKPLLMQAMINKENAIKGSFFHNGWRSMAGWVCVIGLAYSTIISKFLEQVFYLDPVEINISILIDLLVAMLGLAGLRSWEKQKGVAKP